MSLVSVRKRIEAACSRAGRPTASVTVVIVSKGRSAEAIQALYDQGHRHFGENRARELAEKAAVLPSDIHWHFVGPLQSNKVRLVRPTVRLLHSLDRSSLARAWVKGPGMPPPALLQVNIGREEQKGGVDPDEAVESCGRFIELGIEVRGVMAIPPLGIDPRPSFVELRSIRDELADRWPSVTDLSMGMTDDFEIAIEEGATVIRPGRAIFDD